VMINKSSRVFISHELFLVKKYANILLCIILPLILTTSLPISVMAQAGSNSREITPVLIIGPNIFAAGKEATALISISNGNPNSDKEILSGDIFNITFEPTKILLMSFDPVVLVNSTTLTPSDFTVGLGSSANQLRITYTGAAKIFPPSDSFSVRVSLLASNTVGISTVTFGSPAIKQRYNDPFPKFTAISLANFPVGPTGATGPTGAQGVAGATGPQGLQGLQGTTGATGLQGLQGLQGATGATGPQGLQGLQGATGATGPQGLQGLQGTTGATGPQGLQGLQGATGATGTTGANGIALPFAGSSLPNTNGTVFKVINQGTGIAITGEAEAGTTGRGVQGIGSFVGVEGVGRGTGTGIIAQGGNTNGTGLIAIGSGTAGTGINATGSGSSPAIVAQGGNDNGNGIVSTAGGSTGIGVIGIGTGSQGRGVRGNGSFVGVEGNGTGTGFGVIAQGGPNNGTGLLALGSGNSGTGIDATGTGGSPAISATGGSGGGHGVIGQGGGSTGNGVVGRSGTGGTSKGVQGVGSIGVEGTGTFGVIAQSTGVSGVGLFAIGNGGTAGRFDGNVEINGNLNITGSITGASLPAGATGPTGPQGPQGIPGTNGTNGAIGPTGATGATGASFTLPYNNTVAVNDGIAFKVTNNGVENNPVDDPEDPPDTDFVIGGFFQATTWGINAKGLIGGVFQGTSTGIQAISGGQAAQFIGDVAIVGNTTNAGNTISMIDHPLNPTNQYLQQSFVASSEMKNIYDGVVVLDANGEAWVGLPKWFEALNKDFRYQLTAIGSPGRDLYIAEEINNNRFKVAGGKPSSKVSWQITGVRNDPYAEQNRIKVEMDKPAKDRGLYLHPEVYGQPNEKRITNTPVKNQD
ncbi:MAG: hypothetical protein WAQ98_14850, partial [Blastocatellia bacterium]